MVHFGGAMSNWFDVDKAGIGEAAGRTVEGVCALRVIAERLGPERHPGRCDVGAGPRHAQRA